MIESIILNVSNIEYDTMHTFKKTAKVYPPSFHVWFRLISHVL